MSTPHHPDGACSGDVKEAGVMQMDKTRELERIQYELLEEKGPGGTQPPGKQLKPQVKTMVVPRTSVSRVFLRQFLHEAKKK